MKFTGTLAHNRANAGQTISNIILVASAFVWYLIAFDSLKSILEQQNASLMTTITILGTNTGAIALAGLIGTFIVGKIIDRRKFLYAWIISGVILSLIPLTINVNDLTQLMILSLIFGTYFGIGMPATMGYYANSTKIENRAKISGIAFLIVGITFAFTGLLAQTSLFEISLILVTVRLIGLFSLRSSKNTVPQIPSNKQNNIQTHVFSNKSFFLYFVPWLMFTLINYMTIPIQADMYENPNTYTSLAEMEFLVTGIVAVISGFVADKIGRKRLSMIGFMLLGIGYAIIGLASTSAESMTKIENSPILFFSSTAFIIIDGIAWGIFYVIFVFTVWGDLAQGKNSDKFYFFGVLPYVSAYLIQLLFTPFLKQISFIAVFSFASVFLFLAVLPLIYAPETLPEKLMKDRDLKSYIENAQKKAAKLNHKKHQSSKEETPEPDQNDQNYEEAKKLAEKYY